jgi:hypothetical protein
LLSSSLMKARNSTTSTNSGEIRWSSFVRTLTHSELVRQMVFWKRSEIIMINWSLLERLWVLIWRGRDLNSRDFISYLMTISSKSYPKPKTHSRSNPISWKSSNKCTESHSMRTSKSYRCRIKQRKQSSSSIQLTPPQETLSTGWEA